LRSNDTHSTTEAATVDDMGLFRTTIEIRNWERQSAWRALPDTLVDTGSEYTWVPRRVLEELGVIPQRKQGFIVADGRRIDRDVGYALVRVGGSEAPDLIVFAEAGDMNLLGAHSLEGLNLKVDPVRKELVPAGPVTTALSSRATAPSAT
jgi:predicted aspartyl protease